MKSLILMTAMILATLVVSGCSLTGNDSAVAVQVDKPSACTGLAPSFPLPENSYSERNDSPVTVALLKKHNIEYRAANARFNAICK